MVGSLTTAVANPRQSNTRCFVACAPGLEKLLVNELQALGIKSIKPRRAGVDCTLNHREIYNVCLWSRVANRVLFPLGSYQVSDEQTFYQAVQRIDWAAQVAPHGTLAVDFYCSDSCITHSRYGAQLTKDAIVDWFREHYGERPSVDREAPDIRINVYLYRNKARISLDLSGSGLHRRNYRMSAAQAPLKENLAAAILLASRWSGKSGALFDPMCGSGTLLIEGAMIAGNIAPGTLREYFGFSGWLQHEAALWQEVRDEAAAARCDDNIPPIAGADIDRSAIAAAKQNIEAAGLAEFINVRVQDFFAQNTPVADGPGLVVINPPYGERLEANDQIGQFYSSLGRALKRCTPNWQLALFTGAAALFHRTGFSRRVILECKNGPIDCKLFEAAIPNTVVNRQQTGEVIDPWAQAKHKAVSGANDKQAPQAPGIGQFRDRLKKNMRQLNGWCRSAGVTNYRLYDADLPDFAFALDVYQDPSQQAGPYVCMQEYRAPAHIDTRLADLRLSSAADVVRQELACSEEHLAIKRRDRQRGERQYTRLERLNQYQTVAEGDCRFLINLHDYLDCGLFLDHRKVRHWLAKACSGKRFLNLYCYTATATVHAALGGAKSSVSVDLSHKYLEWAEKNFAANSMDLRQHSLVRADCRDWIDGFVKRDEPAFDVIFLDPPTFSNSSATENDWDVQRDHESMIDRCMSILNTDGLLVFSNNFRRFKLSERIPAKYDVQERSRWSLQRDFSRSPKIHQCWFIKQRDISAEHSDLSKN